jgi:hypothetical protein
LRWISKCARAYPRVDEFVAAKRRHEPRLQFRNGATARGLCRSVHDVHFSAGAFVHSFFKEAFDAGQLPLDSTGTLGFVK